MKIYLIRHTKPLIGKDICYGQADIPLDESLFEQTAKKIVSLLPKQVDALYSSPLSRCSKLAQYLVRHKYSSSDVQYSPLLKELNFGVWENKKWVDINQQDLQTWMADFVNETVPGGESLSVLHQRTGRFINLLKNIDYSSVVVVSHAGVIRSMDSHCRKTLLADSFSQTFDYGSVTKLTLA